MVAIKDMEMPSCCAECDLCVEDKYADMTCVLLGSEWEETDYNENHRDEKCPLVETRAEEKLEKIKQIVKQVESLHPEVAIGDREGIRKIKEILEQE